MKAMISFESYEMVQKLANKFAYGNTRSLRYDHYVSVGVEGLKKAVDTFTENMDAMFSTYCYRCVLNAMINEQKRLSLHELETNDGESENLEKWNGAYDEIRDERIESILRQVIKKVVNNNERNAKIVELHIGLEDEPMELKDIAKMFHLSHESVRLVCVKAIRSIREDDKAKELLYSFVG